MNNTKQANDNMSLVELAIHQYLKNDICPKTASILLKTHYQNGWNEQEKEVADLVFSLLCSRTLIELIETVDSGFTRTTPIAKIANS